MRRFIFISPTRSKMIRIAFVGANAIHVSGLGETVRVLETLVAMKVYRVGVETMKDHH
nr:MAG: hypothetical protein BECKTC1821D_GA0114238_109213 [Candidatus Kentron sp. TC]